MIVFNSEENYLDVYIDRDNDGPEDSEKVRRLELSKEYPGIVFGAAHGVHRTTSCAYIDPKGIHIPHGRLAFLPTGTTDRCGSIYIIPDSDLPYRKDRMRALSIILATGRVQMWYFDPDIQSTCPEEGMWRPLL